MLLWSVIISASSCHCYLQYYFQVYLFPFWLLKVEELHVEIVKSSVIFSLIIQLFSVVRLFFAMLLQRQQHIINNYSHIYYLLHYSFTITTLHIQVHSLENIVSPNMGDGLFVLYSRSWAFVTHYL